MSKLDLNKRDVILDDFLEPDDKPSSNNQSTAAASFYNKKLYEKSSFIDRYGNPVKNKPINLLYDKLLYGRVDLNNDAVIVDKTKIRTTLYNDKEIVLMNFVSDAFFEFYNYWEFLKKNNRLEEKSIFYDFKLGSSYVDPMYLYNLYMANILNSIFLQIQSRNIKITNFEDFIDEFIDYVDGVTPKIPITYSSFVISTTATPSISGLCINVNSKDNTSDQVRFDVIKEDPNFEIFKKTALKFGFFIDKQVPWRLFADIDSPLMKPYMDKYSLTQDNLYQKNYFSATDLDLEVLRTYLVTFYNDLIVDKKTVVIPNFKICKSTGEILVKPEYKFVPYLNINNVKIDKEFNTLFMRLYVFIKARENNYNWTNSTFNKIVQEFVQINEQLDTRKAMRYIQPLIKYPSTERVPQRNFQFR